MSAIFYAYPQNAKFGRIVPKNKILTHNSSSKLRRQLTTEIEQIIWAYKLAPETININASSLVREIQIFQIRLKTPNFHQDLLHSIDKTIAFPIIFELIFEEKTKMIAALKRFKNLKQGEKDGWTIDTYLETNWQQPPLQRQTLPIALDMDKLYEQILRGLIPITPRGAESFSEQLARWKEVQHKQKEAEAMLVKLNREKQFNRKVEINIKLRELKQHIAMLT